MAIIPEQQVQTSTLRGADPTQFLQQAYREQQANVAAFNQMNATIQQEAQKFIQKQEEKKQKEMTYSAILPYIQQMSGGDAKQADALAKQIAGNPASSSAILNMVKMSQEQEAKAADQAALQKALAVSTTPSGEIDYASVLQSYIDFGGSDVKGVAGLIEEAKGPGELIIDPKTGVVQQGGKFKGITKVPTKPVEPSVTQVEGERGTYDLVTTESGTRVFPVAGMGGIGQLTQSVIESADSQGIPSFDTEEEALAANLEPGTEVLINGRKAKIQ